MTKRNLDALRLTCRFDAEQADYVRLLSDHMEVPAAEVVRLAVDVLVKRVPSSLLDELEELPPKTRAELARLTQEVNRIGTNVNQVVRAINTRVVDEMFILDAEEDDDVDRQEIEQMRTDLEDLRAVVEREMQQIFLQLVKLRGELEAACQSLKS